MAVFTKKPFITSPVYQYDKGLKLVFENADEIPLATEIHFSNERFGESKTSICIDGVADIYDEYLKSGENVYAWMYIHNSEDDSETTYELTIPVRQRAKPKEYVPTEEEDDTIAQTIVALNVAVEKTAQDVISTGEA